MEHIAMLMGGWSAERSVSLSSGEACARCLESGGYRVSRVDVGRDVARVLSDLSPSVAFNALHGPFGEDGTIQGILEFMEIPYTHSGVMSSALSMNKERAKIVACASGVSVAESKIVNRFEVSRSHAMDLPYVVKPIGEGSSFGVHIVHESVDSSPPSSLASDDWSYSDDVMVERYIPGRELTCAVMGDEALGVIEIIPKSGEFYDFSSKYDSGGSDHILPARILPNIYEEVRRMSLLAHRALGCRGVSRSDFRWDEEGSGELIWLELNTQPGMTSTSLVPEMALHAGYEFDSLLSWILEDSSCYR